MFGNGFTETFDLLIACFAEGGDATRVDWRRPDWESLIQYAGHEFVLPALNSQFQAMGVTSQLPSEVAEFLLEVEELNRERNETIWRDARSVIALLNSVAIEPVLLKGAAYCLTQVYANPAMRYLTDVDLLIPESCLRRAVEVLGQNGFEHDVADTLGHFRHHHPPLRRAQSVPFELHHSIGMGVAKSLLPTAEVLGRSRPLCLASGEQVRIPCPEHMMTHLITHSQIQHPYNERIWPPLRAMYDLVLLQRKFGAEIDWISIENRFRKARQYDTLILHLAQVQDVLHVAPPFPLRLTGLTWLRWQRRRLLRALPVIRFVDPIYMYSTVFTRRIRLLRSVIAFPGGWQQVVGELVKSSFYKRLFADIVEGRGR